MSSYIPRSLLDQAKPEQSDPTYRMSMLPFATYPNADGSGEHLGFAVPGMIQEPMNALMRLIGTPSNPGTFTQGPDYGSNADDMRTLLETFTGGNAMRGAGAVERGAVEAPVAQVSAMPPRRIYQAPDNPMIAATPGTYSAFHGSRSAAGIKPRNVESYWGTPDAGLAGEYAMDSARAPNVAPVDFNFTNPARIDAGGAGWAGIPFESSYRATSELEDIARARGHDGLIIDNVIDPPNGDMSGAGSPSTVIAALRRGTVRSPLTGETLFSDNLPSLPGAVIAGAEKSHPGILDTLRGWFGRSPVDPDVARAQELYHKYPGEMSALPNDVPDWVYIPKNQYNWNEYPNHFFGDDEAIKKAAVNIGEDQAPIGPNDQSYLNALLRQRKIDEGSLFSDTGLPSLWGSALQGQEPINSVLAQNTQPDPWAHRDQPPVEDYQPKPQGLNQWRDERIKQLRAQNPGMSWIDAYDRVINSQEFKDRDRATTKKVPFSNIPDFIPHQ